MDKPRRARPRDSARNESRASQLTENKEVGTPRDLPAENSFSRFRNPLDSNALAFREIWPPTGGINPPRSGSGFYPPGRDIGVHDRNGVDDDPVSISELIPAAVEYFKMMMFGPEETPIVNNGERREAEHQNMDTDEQSFTFEEVIQDLDGGIALPTERSFHQILSQDCPNLLELFETLEPGVEKFWLGSSLWEATRYG